MFYMSLCLAIHLSTCIFIIIIINIIIVEEGTGLNISINCTNNNRFVVTYERVGSSLGNLLTILYTCELNNGTTVN